MCWCLSFLFTLISLTDKWPPSLLHRRNVSRLVVFFLCVSVHFTVYPAQTEKLLNRLGNKRSCIMWQQATEWWKPVIAQLSIRSVDAERTVAGVKIKCCNTQKSLWGTNTKQIYAEQNPQTPKSARRSQKNGWPDHQNCWLTSEKHISFSMSCIYWMKTYSPCSSLVWFNECTDHLLFLHSCCFSRSKLKIFLFLPLQLTHRYHQIAPKCKRTQTFKNLDTKNKQLSGYIYWLEKLAGGQRLVGMEMTETLKHALKTL